MAQETKIQWTDATWNPWKGCIKVSPGCKFCYAEKMAKRFGNNFGSIQRTKDATFNSPLKYKVPTKIFTCSISDFFIEQADNWRAEAWEIIRKTPNHIYQILTKRPERILQSLPDNWDNGWKNVWLGVSAENENKLIERSRIMEGIKAQVKFASIEPLLESMTAHGKTIEAFKVFNWVIVGGESGSSGKCRVCEPEWIFGVIEVCKRNNIPIFVKQMGTKYAKLHQLKDWHGGDISEWPFEALKVRQFPSYYL